MSPSSPSHQRDSQVSIQSSSIDLDDLITPTADHSPSFAPNIQTIDHRSETHRPWYRHLWLWLLITGSVALFGGITVDIAMQYIALYDHSPLISIALLASNTLFMLLLIWLLLKEVFAYWRVNRFIQDHDQMQQQIARANKDEITQLLQQLTHTSQADDLMHHRHQQFWRSIQPHHSGEERLSIYRQLIAEPVREQAEGLIQPAMLQAAGISLISPNNSIHTLILLWRSAKLVKDIALIYGIRPGFFGNLRLLKLALENAILQQGADLVIDAGVSKLSQGVLSLVAEKGAEATVTGLLIRRLAKATIDELDITKPSQT